MKYGTLQYSAGSRKSLLCPTQWSPVSVSFLITKNKEDHMNYNVVDPTLEGLSVTDTLIYFNIEALPFWKGPSRSITWEMGGSQFTKTLCTGFSQTPENDNGGRPHSRFPGFAKIPCTGSWWTGTPSSLQGGRLGPTMTDITERGLLYLAVHNSQKTYCI